MPPRQSAIRGYGQELAVSQAPERGTGIKRLAQAAHRHAAEPEHLDDPGAAPGINPGIDEPPSPRVGSVGNMRPGIMPRGHESTIGA
jgi:hypothetical protein